MPRKSPSMTAECHLRRRHHEDVWPCRPDAHPRPRNTHPCGTNCCCSKPPPWPTSSTTRSSIAMPNRHMCRPSVRPSIPIFGCRRLSCHRRRRVNWTSVIPSMSHCRRHRRRKCSSHAHRPRPTGGTASPEHPHDAPPTQHHRPPQLSPPRCHRWCPRSQRACRWVVMHDATTVW